jgi:hypothetical protein
MQLGWLERVAHGPVLLVAEFALAVAQRRSSSMGSSRRGVSATEGRSQSLCQRSHTRFTWLSQVMRICAVCALRAGVHVACTCRVCALHMLCLCVSARRCRVYRAAARYSLCVDAAGYASNLSDFLPLRALRTARDDPAYPQRSIVKAL